MADIDHYLQAATKDNTRRSYQYAVEHFEDVWGGYLPATADSIAQRSELLPLVRNKALVLLGFWRAFRSDELTRLTVDSIKINPGIGLEIFLPQSKTDRNNYGATYHVPALSRLCPVSAYQDWIHLAMFTEGPVFCGIDQWGNISEKAMHTNSIIPLLRELMQKAGLSHTESYSSHSLRRGFASWANANQWDLKSLMQYVGWKDSKSALRYIDAHAVSPQQRIEAGLSQSSTRSLSSETHLNPINDSTITLCLLIERLSKYTRGMKRTREKIEFHCLRPYEMKKLDKAGNNYQLTIAHDTEDELNDYIETLLFEMHSIADDNQCILEATFTDKKTDQTWD